MESVWLEFGNAGPRFYREVKGFLWETHKNIVVTRTENRDTERTKICRWWQRQRERKPGRKVSFNMKEIVFSFFLPPSFFPFFSTIHPSIRPFIYWALTLFLVLNHTPNKPQLQCRYAESIRSQGRGGHKWRIHLTPIISVSPSSLFPLLFCLQPLGCPEAAVRLLSWNQQNVDSERKGSTRPEYTAGFHCCLRYRQARFKQGPLGSLSRTGRLSLGTWPQTSDSMLPVGDSSWCSAPLWRFYSILREEKCFRWQDVEIADWSEVMPL